MGQTIAGVILKLMGPDYLKQLYLGQKVDYANDQRTLSDLLGYETYELVIGYPRTNVPAWSRPDCRWRGRRSRR